MEVADRAVRVPQVGLRDLVDALRRDLLQPVAVEEEQPPVPHRGPLAQVERDPLGIVEREFDAREVVPLGALDLFLGGRLGRELVEGGEQRLGGLVEGVLLPDHHVGHQHARLVQLKSGREDGGRQPRFDQVPVQTPGRLDAKDVAEHLDRRVLFMGARRHVVDGHHELRVADPPQGYRSLAVLGRLGGVGVEERVRAGAVGARNRAELRGDEFQRPVDLEPAGHDQDRVVRLVVLPVEGLQPLDRHVLEVRPGADRRVAVVVPVEGGRHDPLAEHAHRLVLAPLPLVAHDRHLGLEVLDRDEGVDHPVGLQVERPLQVLVARRERLEVVRAVEPGRAVRERAALGHLGGNVRVVRRALEHQVLQQMRHPRLAVALVPGTDEIGDVHRDLLLAPVGEEQETEAVLQPVLRDPLDRGHLRDAVRQVLRREGQRRRQPREQAGGQLESELRLALHLCIS